MGLAVLKRELTEVSPGKSIFFSFSQESNCKSYSATQVSSFTSIEEIAFSGWFFPVKFVYWTCFVRMELILSG